MNFWTSDNHFGHTNIIGYCGRPFLGSDGQPDVHFMNRTMTERWNATVGPRDTVFHLGDFSMAKHVSAIREYRKKLNGKIILVRGNHDRSPEKMLEAGMDEVHDNLTLDIDGHRLYMAHIPVLVSDPTRVRKYNDALTKAPPKYFDYFLAGHVHEKWKRRGKVINVGVDQWQMTPRTLEELLRAEESN